MFIPQNNPFNIFFDGWDEDKGDIPDIMKSKRQGSYDELSDHAESLFESVPENLTLHRSKKIFFRSYHLVEEICSFPTMYNTWGCLWGQIDETKHFLQKSGLKTPILAATVLDHPTSKRAETHNFWGIVNFHKCFEKSGT